MNRPPIDGIKYQNVPVEADNFPLRLRRYRNRAAFFMHWHDHAELLFFMKGGASIYSGGEEIETRDGDLVIANSGELHRGDFRDRGVNYYCIQLPPDFFSWIGGGERYLFPHCIRGDAAIAGMFDGIYRAYWGRAEGYKYVTLGRVYELMGYLIGKYRLETVDERIYAARSARLTRFNTVIDTINQNCALPLTTRDAAALAHLSEYYFCHLFKERVGLSFVSYLNSARVQKAASLLRNTRMSITEIAAQVGYGDVNYFSRLFKREIGVSPRQYREEKQ